MQAEPEDEIDTLSDSDMEDEADLGADTASLRLTTTTSRSSSLRHQPASTTGDAAPSPLAHTALHAHGDGAGGEDEHDGEFHDASAAGPAGEGVGVGAGAADVGVGMGMEEETRTGEVASKVPPTPGRHTNGRGPVGGPKKTGVVVRDAAWSTWWAILYWVRRFVCLYRASRAVWLTRAAVHGYHLLCTPDLFLRARCAHLLPPTRILGPRPPQDAPPLDLLVALRALGRAARHGPARPPARQRQGRLPARGQARPARAQAARVSAHRGGPDGTEYPGRSLLSL